jgi:hypothetical protein
MTGSMKGHGIEIPSQNLVIGELVKYGTIVKQQKESTPDDPVDRYEVTQNLDKICKDFGHSALS